MNRSDNKSISILIEKLLKPYFYRFKLRKNFKLIMIGLNTGLVLSLFLMFLSRLIVIRKLNLILISIITISIIFSIIIIIVKKINIKESVKEIDKLGFKERITTYTQFKEVDNEIINKQFIDTLNILENNQISKQIFVKPSRKYFIMTLLVSCLIFAISFINTSTSVIAGDIDEFTKKNVEIKKIIEENQEKLNKKLESEELKDLNKQLELLKKSLSDGKNLEKMEKETLKTEKEIEKLSDNIKKKAIKEVVSKMLDGKNKELLEKLLNLKSLDELTSELSKLNLDPELLKNLESIMNNLSNEELKKILDNLSDIKGNLSEFDKKDKDKIEGKGQQGQGKGQQSEGKGQQSEGKGQQSEGQGQQGQGQQGQGQQGEGQQGQGQQGEGQGEGQGYSPGSGEREDALTNGESSNRLDGTTNNTNIKGSLSNIEDSQKIRIDSFGTEAGEVINYADIVSEYQKAELNKLNVENIPPNVKEIIKKYFSK